MLLIYFHSAFFWLFIAFFFGLTISLLLIVAISITFSLGCVDHDGLFSCFFTVFSYNSLSNLYSFYLNVRFIFSFRLNFMMLLALKVIWLRLFFIHLNSVFLGAHFLNHILDSLSEGVDISVVLRS